MLVSGITTVTLLTSKTREKLPKQLLLSHEKQTTKGALPHFHIKKQQQEDKFGEDVYKSHSAYHI